MELGLGFHICLHQVRFVARIPHLTTTLGRTLRAFAVVPAIQIGRNTCVAASGVSTIVGCQRIWRTSHATVWLVPKAILDPI